MPETSPILLLLGSILPLAAGPFLASWADRAAAAKSAVDAFTVVSLGGIVVLHIWPHAFMVAGAWTFVGGFLGLLLPFFLHGALHAHERKIYPGFVVLAFFGLAVHATLDGVALFSPLAEAAAAHGHAPADAHHPEHGGASLLALAVMLHRLPMGFAIWWFAAPILGRRFAVALLGFIAAATVFGFYVADSLLVDLSIPAIAVFEATIAGMLMHVVMGHHHGHAEQEGDETVPWASALGTLAGMALVIGLFKIHPMEQRVVEALAFDEVWITLLSWGAPWLVLAVVLTAVWCAVTEGWARGRSEQLLKLPSATRELSLVAVVLSCAALGGEWTLWRWVGIGWIVLCGALAEKPTDSEIVDSDAEPHHLPTEPRSVWHRLGHHLLRQGHNALVWSLLAVLLIALLEPMVQLGFDLPPSLWQRGLALLGVGLLAIVFYRNALFGSLLAVFLAHQGWHPTLVMVLLLCGSWWVVFGGWLAGGRRIGRRLAMASAALLPLLAATWGLGGDGAGSDVVGAVDLRLLVMAPTWCVELSLGALAVLGLWILFQRGFRGFLHPIFDPADPIEVGGSSHLHSHNHSHG